jgi:hypothetical protein
VDAELEAEGKAAGGALADGAVETSAEPLAVAHDGSFDVETTVVVVELAVVELVEPAVAQVGAGDVALGTAEMMVVVVVGAVHCCHELCVDEKPIHQNLQKPDSHIPGGHTYNVQPLPDVRPSLMSAHHIRHSMLMHPFLQGVLMKYIRNLSHQLHFQLHQMLV